MQTINGKSYNYVFSLMYSNEKKRVDEMVICKSKVAPFLADTLNINTHT